MDELTAACLKRNEEDELVAEREILRKAVQIREKAFEAYHALYSRSGSILESFGDVRKTVDYLVSVNPKLGAIKETLEEALYRIEDVAIELRNVGETSHSDPARLEEIEERLALIRRLRKKYGTDMDGLFQYMESLNQETGEILEARAAVRKYDKETAEERQTYLETAQALSRARRGAAEELETSMKQELQDLSMPEAAFLVSFEETGDEKGSASGLEKVEFFLASNPGEAPRPLARIASGGELSRIMLAIKALQVDSQGSSTVIFDEVDAGIGGHTAIAVGNRLARVAQRQQVLCVTHLHQIAVRADHHLSVNKTVRDKRTRVEVTALAGEKRLEELARMLGASPASRSAIDDVRRLMELPAVEVPR
jgi:DNA repair protein RecN (Recombination protein N)